MGKEDGVLEDWASANGLMTCRIEKMVETGRPKVYQTCRAEEYYTK